MLASADGTVAEVRTDGAGGHRVLIEHDGNRGTHYLHLQALPTLTMGQRVAQGEQIGRAGKSGTESPHLHYTQYENLQLPVVPGKAPGTAVQVEFNGAPIETGLANQWTWNRPPGEREKLTSSNCPGRAFLPFDQDGKHHLFSYAPGPGSRQIATIATSGTTASTKAWEPANPRWTHFMPFKLGTESRYISYKSSTGEADYGRITTASPTKLSDKTWSGGWTHLMPFELAGKPYFVAYNQLNGDANIDRINDTGTGSTTLPSGAWTKGWTLLVPFRLNGVQYMLAYRGSTGEVKINTITGSGDSVTFTTVFQDTWVTGWTHIVPVTHNGAVHLLRYNQSGWASFDKVKPGGTGVTHLAYSPWSRGWTVFSPYTAGGKGHVLAYKTHSGTAKILKLNDDGAGVTTTADMSWMPGLAY